MFQKFVKIVDQTPAVSSIERLFSYNDGAQLLSSSVQLSSMGTALFMTTWLDLLVNYCKRQLVEDAAEHLEFT